MKVLLICDTTIDANATNKFLTNAVTDVNLFSLTSNSQIIQSIKEQFRIFPHISFNVLESAKKINEAVIRMQKTIHEWSSALGNYRINNKKLKEWFLLPDKNVSSWWFGLLSEKNTTQDEAFFKIAQINAIQFELETNNYDCCFVSLKDNRQNEAIKRLLIDNKIKFFTPTKKVQYVFSHLYSLFIPMSKAGIILFKWLAYKLYIQYNLTPLKKRIPSSSPLLFVTPFPNVDEASAEFGVFKNKYMLPLQKMVQANNISITWLIMPMALNNYNLFSGIKLANKFVSHGENIVVLYEFLTIKLFIKGFFWWLRQAVLGMILLRFIDKQQLTNKLTFSASFPIIKYLWTHSFSGPSSIRGILYYLAYQEIFLNVPNIKQCLYFSEMQAWEKALNAAKNKINPSIETLAFQHTIVMRNLFNYFYDASETIRTHQPTDMPLPDKLIANGKLMGALLKESQYPHLIEAEAIRHLYVGDIACFNNRKHKTPLLLVIGSFNKTETRALINMVNSAFPIADNFEILFKGYPYTPIEPLFMELNINNQITGYKIVYDDVSTLLEKSSIVVVAGSAVAIEAIACDCKLIVPFFAEVMQLNPLVDFEADYLAAHSAEEFKLVVNNELASSLPADDTQPSKDFINEYWSLNKQLPRWTEILRLERSI